MNNKLLKFSLPAVVTAFLSAAPAKAVCPVCVVAVGAGLGLSEYLGIDDTIAGVWIGGLLVAMIIWTINWFNKKNWLADRKEGNKVGNKDIRDILITGVYYAMVIWPLISQGFIGNPDNRLLGIDKIILGTGLGSLGFLAATLWYNDLKKKNNGHAWFPFQKVAWPFGALVILSLIFYFLTK